VETVPGTVALSGELSVESKIGIGAGLPHDRQSAPARKASVTNHAHLNSTYADAVASVQSLPVTVRLLVLTVAIIPFGVVRR
jgi:hypothetical protein